MLPQECAPLFVTRSHITPSWMTRYMFRQYWMDTQPWPHLTIFRFQVWCVMCIIVCQAAVDDHPMDPKVDHTFPHSDCYSFWYHCSTNPIIILLLVCSIVSPLYPDGIPIVRIPMNFLVESQFVLVKRYQVPRISPVYPHVCQPPNSDLPPNSTVSGWSSIPIGLKFHKFPRPLTFQQQKSRASHCECLRVLGTL